jgi:NADH-quinone oxidoreductase subunit M
VLFFISFAVKVPIYPFHIWLPEAHVESPTEGSVILAAILLKVGGYGFLRVLLPMFPSATQYFSSLVTALCAISIVYTSVATLRQTDIKRIVAYSSVSHMNIAIIGILNYDALAISGSVLLMLGHGIVSGGLFFVVGILYTRVRTKVVAYYSGIIQGMPLLCAFFFLFLLGNMSMPGTSNFIGEFLVLVAAVGSSNLLLPISVSVSILLCAVYTLYLYNRIAYGMPYRLRLFRDITFNECVVLCVIAV